MEYPPPVPPLSSPPPPPLLLPSSSSSPPLPSSSPHLPPWLMGPLHGTLLTLSQHMEDGSGIPDELESQASSLALGADVTVNVPPTAGAPRGRTGGPPAHLSREDAGLNRLSSASSSTSASSKVFLASLDEELLNDLARGDMIPSLLEPQNFLQYAKLVSSLSGGGTDKSFCENIPSALEILLDWVSALLSGRDGPRRGTTALQLQIVDALGYMCFLVPKSLLGQHAERLLAVYLHIG